MPWTDRGTKTINPNVVNQFVLSATNVSVFFVQVLSQDALNVRKYGDLWLIGSASPFGTPIGAIYDYTPIWRPYTAYRLPTAFNIIGYEFKPNKAFTSAIQCRFATFTP